MAGQSPYPHHSRPRTLPDSIFSQRGAHFSCGTDHEGEGGRETAGQDKTRQYSAAAERKREGQKATLSNRVARSVGRSFSGFLTRDFYVPAS